MTAGFPLWQQHNQRIDWTTCIRSAECAHLPLQGRMKFIQRNRNVCWSVSAEVRTFALPSAATAKYASHRHLFPEFVWSSGEGAAEWRGGTKEKFCSRKRLKNFLNKQKQKWKDKEVEFFRFPCLITLDISDSVVPPSISGRPREIQITVGDRGGDSLFPAAKIDIDALWRSRNEER